MIAFDTCMLVRFLADDDKAQADLAETLMRDNAVFWIRAKRICRECQPYFSF